MDGRRLKVSECPHPSPVAARSPTGQLNSACHQDVGHVYLSGVYMYFNLELCQPAQLTPAEPPPPTPTTVPCLRREGWRMRPVPQPLPAGEKEHLIWSPSTKHTYSVIQQTFTEGWRPCARHWVWCLQLCPQSWAKKSSLCLSFPVWPQGV